MDRKQKIRRISMIPLSFVDSLIYKKPKVMTKYETVDYILNNKDCGISRYGDGELSLMLGTGILFQDYDAELQRRLIGIAKNHSDNCLICLPNIFRGGMN